MASIEQRYADFKIPSGGSGIESRYAIHSKSKTTPSQAKNRESIKSKLAPIMRAIESQSTSLKDRAKTAIIGGIPAAAAGIKPEQASKAADFVTPSITSMAGTPFGPKGIALGAALGRGINETGKMILGLPQSEARPVLGFGPMAPGPVNDVISEGLGTYLGGKAVDKAGKTLVKVAPQMKSKGVEIVQKILRPGGKLKDKSAEIAENAIKYDVIRDDLSETAGLVEDKLGQLDDALESLIQQYQSKRMSGDDVINSLDEIADFYTKNAAPDQAAAVSALKDDFIKAHQLKMPVYGEVERGGFVMGPSSKQVNPQITQSVGDEIPTSLRGKKRFESVRTESGRYGRSEPKREIITPAQSVENPDDIVAMNIPKRKVGIKLYHGTDKKFKDFDIEKSSDGSVWFTDNKSKILRGEVGASGRGNIIERYANEGKLKLAGWEENDKYSMGQLMSMGYDGLKLPGGEEVTYQIFYPEKLYKSMPSTAQKIVSASPRVSYSIRPETRGVGTKSTEVIGTTPRQIPVGEAQSLKRGQYELLKKMRSEGGYNVQTQAPEIMGRQAAARAYKEGVAKNVPGADALNKQMSELLDVGAATNARLPVAQRNNFFDLGDVVLASGGRFDLGAARKILGINRAKIAKSLYGGSKKVAEAGERLSNPVIQALLQSPGRLMSVLGDN